ncbi:MAG: MFS transporter [Dehalococcoidia bacterium]|nr:MFS transporter [Dehalococcoidia bacterium]MDP7673861.1 MFS transporter [Dehalococcoidia bacterium]HJN94385.1 MFS transporter [Gammaproteobacteria bacterium]
MNTLPTPNGRPNVLPSVAPKLLKNSQFLKLWSIGWVTSSMMWLEMLVIPLLTLELTDSPFLVSFVFFLRFVPMLFGFGLGVLSERINRKHLLTSGLIVQAATALTWALLAVTGSVEFWHLAVGSFLIGIVMTSDFPVRRTMMGEIVDRSQVGRAMSLEMTSSSFFRILGPFAGGVLLGTVGAYGGFLLAALLYLVGLIIAVSTNYLQPLSTERYTSPKTQMTQGISYIRRNEIIIGTLVVTLVVNAFGFSYMSQQPVVARQVLEVSDVLIGVLQSVEGVGMFLGAALVTIFARPHQYIRIYMGSSLLYLLTITLFSQSNTYWASLLILFLSGIGMSGFAAMQSAIMVYTSSQEMRGRVMGSVTMFIGFGPLGALGIGMLAGFYTIATAVMITACIGIACTLIVFIVYPSMRTSKEPKQDITGSAV